MKNLCYGEMQEMVYGPGEVVRGEARWRENMPLVWDLWSQVREERVVTDARTRSIVFSGKKMLLEEWRQGGGR